MGKTVKISREELKDAISESIRRYASETTSARLDEMARVGFIGGDMEVYVWTDDDGYVPHVHVRDKATRGKEFETCIILETNAYFLHGHYNDVFNAAARKAFNNFMHAPCQNIKYENNYEYAIDMWNGNNSKTNISPKYDDYGHIIVPDYTTIEEN